MQCGMIGLGRMGGNMARRLVRGGHEVVVSNRMLGFLFQWPTLIALIMFPILVTMYVKLARREEREVLEEFGEQYARYAAATPAFIPGFGLRQRVA